MMFHPIPTKASVFFDALDAANRRRHDDHPQADAPRTALGAGRWAAIAMIPVALVAVSWML